MELLIFSRIAFNEIDLELPTNTSSRYYSVNEFQKLYKPKNLNIFHTNINGLESKIDNLHKFLSGTSNKMDILSITESSEQEDVGFLTNIDINGYNKFHTFQFLCSKIRSLASNLKYPTA